MRPQFQSPRVIIELRPGALGQEATSGRPEQKYLPSDQRLEWPDADGHYSSRHALVSFTLPILTDKNLNITLLPQKSEKGAKEKQVKRTLFG